VPTETDACRCNMMALVWAWWWSNYYQLLPFVATAEVIALLGLCLFLVDVDADPYTIIWSLKRPQLLTKQKQFSQFICLDNVSTHGEVMEICEWKVLIRIEDQLHSYWWLINLKRSEQFKKAGLLVSWVVLPFFSIKEFRLLCDCGAILADKKVGWKNKNDSNHGNESSILITMKWVNSRLDSIQAAYFRC